MRISNLITRIDIENKQNIDELGKKQRHPGNQCWSALGGFECATLKKSAIIQTELRQ